MSTERLERANERARARRVSAEKKLAAQLEAANAEEEAKASAALDTQPNITAGRTPPFGSASFSPSSHAQCIGTAAWREFMAGNIDLPKACLEGHVLPRTPASRGLFS